MTDKNKRGTLPLGIEDWRSYASFRAGARWMLRGDTDEARRMFSRALGYEEENWGALFNLATLDLSSEPKDYERALRRLHEVKRGVEKHDKEREKRDLVWYKAMYQLAAAYSYDGNNPHRSVDKAERVIDELTRTIRETLAQTREELRTRAASKKLSDQRLADSLKRLKTFLEDLQPLAEILHAGILVENGEVEKAQKIVSDVEKEIEEGNLSYRARYNLACFYSRRASIENAPDSQRSLYEEALGHLEYALERYDSLTRWASEDPELENLQQHAASKRKFDELVEKYAAPTLSKAEDKLPLADLAAIGGTYAALLEEHGISSRDDLILKADTPEAQQTLAEGLGIDVSLVRRWALLADLLRLVDIEAGAVNLLEAAGVGSLRELRVRDPQRLTGLLSQENRARSLVEQPPTLETVRRWVRDAGSTTLPIVAS